MSAYTVDSSFLSAPVGTADVWAVALRQHGAADASHVALDYFTFGAVIGINADLALAQAVHETGWFTSAHWLNQFDPAGLGVIDDSAAGATFLTIEDGIKAHYEHLVCYTMAADPPVIAEWGMLDARHGFHDNAPLVSDLIRPERKWAVPGDGYAQSIVDIANQVIGAAAPIQPSGGNVATQQWRDGTDVPVPTQEEMGFPVEVDWATFYGPSRALADLKWWVGHDTEGGDAGSEVVLLGPTASAHFQIDRDGSIEYEVPITVTAWTPGNDDVAKRSINVEKVGFAATGYTEEQYKAEAACYRWCVAQGMTGVPAVYIGKVDADGGPLPDVAGMLGHADVPNPNIPGAWGGVAGHTDPGPLWDWNHFIALATGAPAQPGGSPTYRLFKETGHGIDGGFKTWWEAHQNPLGDIGFPVTEEVQYGGRTTQCFQRVVVQWFPEFKGTPNEFQTMLTGAFFARDVLGVTGLGIPPT